MGPKLKSEDYSGISSIGTSTRNSPEYSTTTEAITTTTTDLTTTDSYSTKFPAYDTSTTSSTTSKSVTPYNESSTTEAQRCNLLQWDLQLTITIPIGPLLRQITQ